MSTAPVLRTYRQNTLRLLAYSLAGFAVLIQAASDWIAISGESGKSLWDTPPLDLVGAFITGLLYWVLDLAAIWLALLVLFRGRDSPSLVCMAVVLALVICQWFVLTRGVWESLFTPLI
jgi:hypothetical protein